MDLLEYQAKALFQEMGIPVLPSQRIYQPKDLKGLKIPYPIVLKSQVRRGGRGRLGGIRFVENTIDAIAAAQAIFHLSISGDYPELLLAEAKYDAEREFFLAVALDSSVRRPVLLGSQQGGENLEAALHQMQQVVVDQDFSPFYARRLALKMGLQGVLVQSISTVVEKMYQLFVQKDLDLIEINPLAIDASGAVMALDGKVTVNDGALGRHSEIALLTNRMSKTSAGSHSSLGFRAEPPAPRSEPTLPPLVRLDGNIGILCNGAGLTMTTLDLVAQGGGKTANFLNIGGEFHCGWPTIDLTERVQQGLDLILQDKRVKVVLINLLNSLNNSNGVAAAIGVHLRPKSPAMPSPHFVIRCPNQRAIEQLQAILGDQVFLSDRLDDAVAQIIALAKPPRAGRATSRR
ncbi:ATPase [Leptolyngbya sp. 'hensonii']|uniref:ATP-grasp domain-containing protein n=1 Tax=Leptolyngbya sp. 'hensonii' TaxID=1922337 RepID=UPI00094FDC90|nr:ATP-grasp domain-containing protein [Leptolyngbya sp. 'hensonii']OLP17679.1 ATPase [Leptolyngbya sp. 'hensonii']